MFIEIAIPSYFGSTLTKSSEQLPYDIFKSNWLVQSESYKKSLKILVERTLRPISIRAGHVFHLNLSTMLSVIKTF